MAITGTWTPATINTATVGTTTYTFTPTDASQCATAATMDITVTPQVTPTFTQIGPLCQNSTAPLLPVHQQWHYRNMDHLQRSILQLPEPLLIHLHQLIQCATAATMNIAVTPQVTPTFTQIGPLCQNSTAPTLPATSNNGITGTWSLLLSTQQLLEPLLIHLHQLIQCATAATMDITVTTQVTPTFTQIGPLCQNSTAPALPATSTMVLPEHGTLQRSILQQLEPLLIHLHQLMPQCATVATMDITITHR